MRRPLAAAMFALCNGIAAQSADLTAFSGSDAIRLHPEAGLFAGGLDGLRAPLASVAAGDGERSLLGFDIRLGGGAPGLQPFVGASIGFNGVDGDRAMVGGPTVGLALGEGIEARLSYEFVEDRGAEAGTVTLGIGFLNF